MAESVDELHDEEDQNRKLDQMITRLRKEADELRQIAKSLKEAALTVREPDASAVPGYVF
jgi:hypothetical protein